MKKVYRTMLALCVVALLIGVAFGYPGYPTNSTNDTANATNNTNTTNVTGGKTPTVTSTPTVTGTVVVPTETTVKPTTVKPTDVKPTTPKETPKETPGFGIVTAIGILSVVYIFGKRR